MENWKLEWTKLTSVDEVSGLKDSISGVYRLSYLHDNGNYYVFYVGQSEDIKSRLLKHMGNDELNARLKVFLKSQKCFFRYAKITQEYVRSAVERQAYKYYQPECNQVEPSGKDDVKGNLD